MLKKKVIIIGAGPAGLSTGYHLKNRGFNDFLILEKQVFPGGLSASFKDKKGFIWDIGGHIIHEGNQEFVNFAKKILADQLICHQRKAFIYFKNHLIPYPFQNNIAFLQAKYKQECLEGLISNPKKASGVSNFYSWILANFGEGIAKYFMFPQNQKSWCYPLKKMGTFWLKKRVSLPSLKIIERECWKVKPDEINWGSHQRFFYPKKGGIGVLWKKTAELLGSKVIYNSKILKINLKRKVILMQKDSSQKSLSFDFLVSTMPLKELIKIINAPLGIIKVTKQLKYNSGLVMGLGFKEKPKIDRWHWLYFPDKHYQFFRVCLLSKFSKNMVPKDNFSSFMIEISWRKKIPNQHKIIKEVTKQIGKIFFNKEKILPFSTFSLFVPYYYPIPTLGRNKILREISKFLERHQVFSFGRFGSWHYEKGNMDDCFSAAQKTTEDLF